MERIEPLSLIPELDARLLQVLKSLDFKDWNLPTIAPAWTIRDVAAHLLDVSLRTVAHLRDDFTEPLSRKVKSYDDLVDHLNEVNARWVNAARRLSPALMIELLEYTLPLHVAALKSLDTEAEAPFPVAWAGEEKSRNWFHIAREYTEKFHHQMQIRDALQQTEPLMQSRFYVPFLDTSVRALPFHYRNIPVENGSAIGVLFPDFTDSDWVLTKGNGRWELTRGQIDQILASIEVDKQVAWKLFTRGISAADAKKASRISGPESLTEPFFHVLAVMARHR